MPTSTDRKPGRFQPGESGNPNGRPVLHNMRRLAVSRRGGVLDDESEAAVCTRMNEYADAAGGLAQHNNRELALLRDAAICDLIIAEAFAYARRRGSIFRRDGQLIPVLDRNLLAYMNSKRLALVALGLRPDRVREPSPIPCNACGQTYTTLPHKCPADAAARAGAADAASMPVGSEEPTP